MQAPLGPSVPNSSVPNVDPSCPASSWAASGWPGKRVPQGCSRSQAGPDSNRPASDPGLPISPSDPGSRFPFVLLLPPSPENFLSEPLSNEINCFRGGELPVPGGMQGDAHKGQGILSSQGGSSLQVPPPELQWHHKPILRSALISLGGRGTFPPSLGLLSLRVTCGCALEAVCPPDWS